MLKVGIVGFGFMGRMHYRVWKGAEGAEVAAVCDANPNIIEDSKKAVGNIDGAEDEIDFDSFELYREFDKLISDGKIDAISLTLPTYLHADFTVRALEAGLHVLCEKPMALTTAECERMAAAAEKSGKILQIGHCVRFWPEYAKTKEIVASGQYGRVHAVSMRRLGCPPTWSEDNWFLDEDRSGGMALDLHIHDTDYIEYLLGIPNAVRSVGSRSSQGHLLHISTQYLYDDGMTVTAEGGWGMAPQFGFEMSFNIVLDKATIVYDLTRDPAFRVIPADGVPVQPVIGSGDGYTRQAEHFVKRAAGERVPEVITLADSMNSVKIIEAEKESIKTGGRVEV